MYYPQPLCLNPHNTNTESILLPQKYIQTIVHWDLSFYYMEANLFPTTYTYSFQHYQSPRITYGSYFRTFTGPKHTKTLIWLENIHTCDAHDIKCIRFFTTQIITEAMDIQVNCLECQCSLLATPPHIPTLTWFIFCSFHYLIVQPHPPLYTESKLLPQKMHLSASRPIILLHA